MKRLFDKYFWQAAFLGWAALIFVLSIIPSSGLIEKSNDKETFRWDYVEHFGVFVVFTILFGMWARKHDNNRRRKELIIFLAAGGIYAAATELIQLFIESRSYNPVDLVFNLIGLIIGLVIVKNYVFK